MSNYFFIGASKDHVLKGKQGGFVQAGHGKKSLVDKLVKGDWFVYYSSKEKFEDKQPYQKFTAIGRIAGDKPYQSEAKSGIQPFRIKATYRNAKDADIRALIDKLEFIKNKKRWGFYIMSGFREISENDFSIIKKAMIDEDTEAQPVLLSVKSKDLEK